MARTRIKYCGLTRPEDLELCGQLGIDAVGFVFHPKSKRAVAAKEVKSWLQHRPALTHTVFLFMDPDAAQVHTVLDQVQPDYLQFHGRESADFCAAFGLPYIKALPMGNPEQAAAFQADHAGRAAFWLADSHGGAHASGGSGHRFDWAQIPELPAQSLIAGGLRIDNVGELIRTHHPWGIDLSSGIEEHPGIKSARKMVDFAAAVRLADAAVNTPVNETSS
nr:phosphoribosylanthranilate isomerase [Oceanococcus sp. HetDA_MAG_MS8]